MANLYQFLLPLSFILIAGCSSGSGDLSAIETCYDVKIRVVKNSQTKNMCTTSENGGYNGLGVARFLRFTLNSANTVAISVDRTSGLMPADPDIVLYKDGKIINIADSTASNSESMTVNLSAGNYVVELNEYVYSSLNQKQQENVSLQKTIKSNIQVLATLPSTCIASSGVSTVSGVVSFDRVNHLNNRLDYTNITQEPVQQALVEVICNGGAYSSTVTDAGGNYSLVFPNNMASFVRVNAQMLTVKWDFSVVDNTASSGQPIYAMDGASFTVSTNQTRNLHASSGWGGSAYTGARVAGPFAILDSIRKAKDKVLSVATVTFPALKVNWSPNNTLSSINSSFYDGKEIFLLGDEDNDTDEYDEHVIIHEWGHYFEFNFSRSNSIGGSHGSGDILDIRVAFGEGFGNAFSSIVTDIPLYVDSLGPQQANGFVINMENNSCLNEGWYSECSVQSVLYDIYDSNDDALDTLSLGFTPIYNVLVGEQKNSQALTSIFSFIKPLKDQNAGSANLIDLLLGAQSIDAVMDIYGSSQITANPGETDQLPVYELF